MTTMNTDEAVRAINDALDLLEDNGYVGGDVRNRLTATRDWLLKRKANRAGGEELIMDKFDAVAFIENSFATQEHLDAFRYLLKVWNTNDERTREEYEAGISPHDHNGEPVF